MFPSATTIKRFVLLVCGALLLLQGCGFHLRGSRSAEIAVSKVYIVSRGGGGSLAAETKQQLGYYGVTLVNSKAQADAVVTIHDERHDERALSFDPRTGKAREYELGYQAEFSVQRPDGTLAVDRQLIELTRDFTFDETAALGKFEEASLIRSEMERDAVDAIIRQLESMTKYTPATAPK